MEHLKCIEAMDFMKDWKSWMQTLHSQIESAEKLGVSEETIKTIGVSVGNFLAEKVCPATKEEELLRDMWDVASPEERKTLATLIFKMAQQVTV